MCARPARPEEKGEQKIVNIVSHTDVEEQAKKGERKREGGRERKKKNRSKNDWTSGQCGRHKTTDCFKCTLDPREFVFPQLFLDRRVIILVQINQFFLFYCLSQGFFFGTCRHVCVGRFDHHHLTFTYRFASLDLDFFLSSASLFAPPLFYRY